MTKEELAKEAEEWVKEKMKEKDFGHFPIDCIEAYLAGAEPREKRITELEAQINRAFDILAFKRKRIAELEAQIEKEKERAKELEDIANGFKADCDRLLKISEEASKQIDKKDEQIETMKCCGNCRFDYCERSSERIDKDGNRTFHCWNEEKEKYCDVGKNGKYQCWEIKEK